MQRPNILFRKYLKSCHYPRCYTTTNVRSIILRPYQESCLQACLEAFREGVRRIGVSLPTGSGKTTVFISLIHCLPSRGSATRALVIVNSIELARQAANQARTMFPELSVEMEQGTKYRASGNADITVATYQTLLQTPRISKFDPNCLKVIIVDEAHHAAAPSYRRILGHFNPYTGTKIVVPPTPEQHLSSTPIFGFSATFGRHDGISLGSVFEKIVYHRDFLQMIKEQWLCDVRFTTVRARIDLSQVTVSTRTGDFNATSLAHIVNTDTINELVVRSWLDRASSRKSTLVFCVNLAHVRDLTREFRSVGVDARYIYSKTPSIERHSLLEAFRRGEFPVLINCAILTEGADIPNIDCVVVARPTRSKNVFAQMIGRGMRLSPETGKTDCHIIDFVDSTSRVPGIITVPTLFGLDADTEIKNESLETLERRAEKVGFEISEVPEPTSVIYVDYDNPFSLVHDASGSPHVATLSSFGWVACGGEIYILECLGRGYIRIEPLPDNSIEKGLAMGIIERSTVNDEMMVIPGEPMFQAHYTPMIVEDSTPIGGFKRNFFRRSRRILTANSLDEAIRGCDTYAKEHVMFGTMILGLLRTAKWRKMLATDGQKEFIRSRWLGAKNAPENSKTQLDIDKLTRGEAANIITRLKHGAQARYKKASKKLLKDTEAKRKEFLRQAREVVRVGPLISD